MPATVIAERLGWEHSSSVLRARVAQLRTAYKARTAAMRGPMAAAGAQVGSRALSDYDDLFALNTPSPAASVVRPDLQVVR